MSTATSSVARGPPTARPSAHPPETRLLSASHGGCHARISQLWRASRSGGYVRMHKKSGGVNLDLTCLPACSFFPNDSRTHGAHPSRPLAHLKQTSCDTTAATTASETATDRRALPDKKAINNTSHALRERDLPTLLPENVPTGRQAPGRNQTSARSMMETEIDRDYPLKLPVYTDNWCERAPNVLCQQTGTPETRAV